MSTVHSNVISSSGWNSRVFGLRLFCLLVALLVAEVTDDMRLAKEEQFGPVLPILKYTDIDEAIYRANDSEMGLGGSVWSGNIEQAKSVASRLECGTVWINGHGAVSPHVPFGGVKSSGLGVEFGIEGLTEILWTFRMPSGRSMPVSD